MIKSVLFVCNMNSVRSPMAAAILEHDARGKMRVDSAGVYEGGLDPFIGAVLGEAGMILGDYEPKAITDTRLDSFDLVIALTPEAAGELRRSMAREKIEYWPIDNPSDAIGGREALLNAYRAVRDDLRARIQVRFPGLYEKP
ncbi:MAG: low molecular weight phosphatase family protein [Parvularculaceae bacterium]|nr:low molecular weight phosphatase family protein [Parvularculaceae bacterium]